MEKEYEEVDSVAGRTMYLFDRLIDALERRRARDEEAKKAIKRKGKNS